MDNVSRYEFMGSPFIFWFACVTIILIPLALLYLINRTVRVETEVPDGEELVSRLREKA